MDKSYLINELKEINAARINRLRVSNIVLKSESYFLPLMQITFDTDTDVSVKAAWVLEFVVNEKIDWLLNNIDYFTKNIYVVKNGSAVRPIAKICEMFALYLNKNHSEKIKYKQNIKDIIDIGFDWMLSDHKIAIKVYTMQTLFIFGKDYPWIYTELKIILEKNIPLESFGYRSRALKILNKIS
jgi:hypothetical protein